MNLKMNSLSGRFLIAPLLLLGLLLFGVQGCGKYGPPTPNDPSRSFTLEVAATPTKDCIAFTGKLSGAFENMDSLRLELAPVNGPEDCPGCPFIPKDVLFFSANDANLDWESGEFAFAYCPRKAPAYRWRMAGISKYSSVPHSLNEETLLLMTSQ